jgi:hypothetical protein
MKLKDVPNWMWRRIVGAVRFVVVGALILIGIALIIRDHIRGHR